MATHTSILVWGIPVSEEPGKGIILLIKAEFHVKQMKIFINTLSNLSHAFC